MAANNIQGINKYTFFSFRQTIYRSQGLDLDPLSLSYMVEGGGFEPPKLARQIYSLIPLATREPLRKERGIFLV